MIAFQNILIKSIACSDVLALHKESLWNHFHLIFDKLYMKMHLSSSEPRRVLYVKFLSSRMMNDVRTMYFLNALCSWTSRFMYRIDRYLIQIPIQKITQLKFSTVNLLNKSFHCISNLLKWTKAFAWAVFYI